MRHYTESKQTNVLIIGGGLAAARAAVEASSITSPVMLVSRVGLAHGGSKGVYKFGALSIPNSETDPEDNPEEMFQEIVGAGRGMCDQNLARILSYDILDRFIELRRWGLMIPAEEKQHVGCFSKRPRMLNIFRGSTNIIDVLKQQIQKRHVTIIDNVLIAGLLVKDGVCVGALGVNKQGRLYVIKAKATVMATGGVAAVFPPIFDAGVVGAGHVMGFHAGAELLNVEFLQMVPGFLKGLKVVPYFLYPEIYNKLGERFLPRYLPKEVTLKECFDYRVQHVSFSSGDNGKYIDISIQKELLEDRGTKEGGVYFDFSSISRERAKDSINASELGDYTFGSIIDTILAKPQLVRPDVHASNGGLKINEKAETTLPGLYAAGEVAAGPHGADRLGGNMFAASLVFGTRAGKFAAERANGSNEVTIDKEQVAEACHGVISILENKGKTSVKEIENKIRDVMWRNCLIVRNHRGLVDCISELKRIRHEELPSLTISTLPDVFRALSVPNMLDAGEIIAYAALQRKESRGSHFREDYPDLDDMHFSRTIKISKRELVL